MNLDTFNKWLTLVANLGVLIGIFVVAIELQQTQTAMQAQASTERAQMAREDIAFFYNSNIGALEEKIRTGQELTLDEDHNIRVRVGTLARNFENLHFLWQLGVLDEEYWQSNLYVISRLCSSPSFMYMFPDFPNGFGGNVHRASFVELVQSFCE